MTGDIKQTSMFAKAVNMALMEGKYDEAISIIEQLSAKEDNYDTMITMGNLIDLKGLNAAANGATIESQKYLFDRAYKIYEYVLSKEPDNIKALIDTGDYWYRLDNAEKALKCYLAAERLIANSHRKEELQIIHSELYRSLKNIWAEKGNIRESIKYKNILLSLDHNRFEK